ncbi:MAG TPA: methyltransferase domain-containing protein [Phaeodactylibacter sp.]|nr:methyltransferase domain-containing protein [Phaeodactylibacter sp.]
MSPTFFNKENEYQVTRYPATNSRSLKAWNTADEYLLQRLEEYQLSNVSIAIFNDRFGFLSCLLYDFSPIIILNYKSQKKAIIQNATDNLLKISDLRFQNPLDIFSEKINIGIFKIPKSLELFRLQLFQLSQSLADDAVVLGAFMTKYFSPKIITIASEFFENVEQSRAWKKSRLIILQKKKPFRNISITHTIAFEKDIYQQYFGVFSAKNIDYASQFFIQHWMIKKDVQRVLDLASGNGILAKKIKEKNPSYEVHLMDDAYLAIESSRLNLTPEKETNPEKIFFHWNDTMDIFENDFFDLVVSNPPFHFEYETNIEVAIHLFQEVKRCLKNGGQFQLVASRHLNFKTHLEKIFESVLVILENDKFIIYMATDFPSVI